MDDGLIFPYPQKSAHAEPSDTQLSEAGEPSGELVNLCELIW